MKTLIVDDHPMVAQGIGSLLEQQAGEIIVASNSADGLRLHRQRHPDIVVVDLAFDGGPLSGLNFIQRLRVHDRSTPIVVLTMHADPAFARRAIALGANAYIMKDASPFELQRAIAKALRGEQYISADLAIELAFEDGRPSRLKDLTLRELETLSSIAAGKSYRAIADELHVGYKTVVNTVAVLKQKLGAGTLHELTRIAVETIPRSGGKW